MLVCNQLRPLKILLLLGWLLFLFGACGGSDGAEEITGDPTDDSTPETSEDNSDNRDDAPDFSLTLGDGSVYTLSADPNPVFMVFWAEW